MTKILVTGATGFVGLAVVKSLLLNGRSVLALGRSIGEQTASQELQWIRHDLTSTTPIPVDLQQVDSIVHLAGIAHLGGVKKSGSSSDPFDANVSITVRLAEQAAASRVRRFVFVSTIGVHGEQTSANECISETSVIRPNSAYAQSKWRAEEMLREIVKDSDMELVVLRPALVVGPGAPGNVAKLKQLVQAGIPIPIPFTDNARSFVSLCNLSELISRCIDDQRAVERPWVVANPEWPSTREVMEWIARGSNRKPRFIKLPSRLLEAAASVCGQRGLHQKLYGDFVVDSSSLRTLLGWSPSRDIARAFLAVGEHELLG